MTFYCNPLGIRNDRDWVGLIFNYLVIAYTVFALILALLYGFGQYDPLYFLYPKMTLGTSFVFSIIRQIYFLISFQWIFLNGRTCVLLTIGMSVSFIRVLSNLKSKPVQSQSQVKALIRLYREFSIMLSLLSRHTNSMLGKCLVGIYVVIALGLNCAILGLKKGAPKLFITFTVVMLTAFCSVLFIFKIGCFIYYTSEVFLKRWQDRCTQWRGFRGTILRREVTCCRPLMIKAGDISVINGSLAQGYLNALLLDSMNVLIICSTYWSLV